MSQMDEHFGHMPLDLPSHAALHCARALCIVQWALCILLVHCAGEHTAHGTSCRATMSDCVVMCRFPIVIAVSFSSLMYSWHWVRP